MPEPLVGAEMERRLHDLVHRLEAQGADLEQYLEATGQAEEELIDELRRGADRGGQGRPRAAGAWPTPRASRPPTKTSTPRSPVWPSGSGRSPRTLRDQLDRADQLPAVRSDIRKAQGAGVARRARRDRRRGGSTRSIGPLLAAAEPSRRDRRTRAGRAPSWKHRSGGPRSVMQPIVQLPRARRSSSRPTGASGPSTSTPGCSRSTSSSSARRSTTPSPTWSCAQLLLPRVREPRQGHQPLHQLARRRHHRPVRHLRHDAVRQERRSRTFCYGPGRVGRRRAARGRHQGQALRAAARPHPASTSPTAAPPDRRPTSRSRPRRSCACATSSTR